MRSVRHAMRRAINPLSTAATMWIQSPIRHGGLRPAAPSVISRGGVDVPNVIGLSWELARSVLAEHGLRAVSPDDGAPLEATAWPDDTVIRQRPAAQTRARVRTGVRLWFDKGGGSAGVREPRRPTRPPRAVHAMRDEPSDDIA